MNPRLEKNQKAILLPKDELLSVFNRRVFFTEKYREEFADKLGGKTGIIKDVPEKYEYDYFYFAPDDDPSQTYSIPYQSIDFSKYPIADVQLPDLSTITFLQDNAVFINPDNEFVDMAKEIVPLLPISYNFQYDQGLITNFVIITDPSMQINISIMSMHLFNQKYKVFKKVEARDRLEVRGSFKKAKSTGVKIITCELNPEYKYYKELGVLIGTYLDIQEESPMKEDDKILIACE